nr:hypothetical protein GZ1D1_8 [uncultured archaeon GZfos1D1]
MPVAIRCATHSGSGMWLWVAPSRTTLAASEGSRFISTGYKSELSCRPTLAILYSAPS